MNTDILFFLTLQPLKFTCIISNSSFRASQETHRAYVTNISQKMLFSEIFVIYSKEYENLKYILWRKKIVLMQVTYRVLHDFCRNLRLFLKWILIINAISTWVWFSTVTQLCVWIVTTMRMRQTRLLLQYMTTVLHCFTDPRLSL
jgi:hypothetical protein